MLSRYPGHATCLPRQAAVKTPEDRVQYAHPCAIQPHAQIMFDLPISAKVNTQKLYYDVNNVSYICLGKKYFFCYIFYCLGRNQQINQLHTITK